jgi:hypothetical protein
MSNDSSRCYCNHRRNFHELNEASTANANAHAPVPPPSVPHTENPVSDDGNDQALTNRRVGRPPLFCLILKVYLLRFAEDLPPPAEVIIPRKGTKVKMLANGVDAKLVTFWKNQDSLQSLLVEFLPRIQPTSLVKIVYYSAHKTKHYARVTYNNIKDSYVKSTKDLYIVTTYDEQVPMQVQHAVAESFGESEEEEVDEEDNEENVELNGVVAPERDVRMLEVELFYLPSNLVKIPKVTVRNPAIVPSIKIEYVTFTQ